MDRSLRYDDSEASVQIWACLGTVNWAGGRGGSVPGGSQASCFPFLIILFIGEQRNQLLFENEERGQPMVVAFVSFDPVITRSGAVGRGDDD